jgi:hypothetical protein
MTHLNTTILAIHQILNHCPSCGSPHVLNKNDDPTSTLKCHTCNHTWTEMELALNRELIQNILITNNLNAEANLLKEMSYAAYRDLLETNFDITPILH